MDLKKAAVNTMAAIAIGSTILTTPIAADALEIQPFFSSTNVVLAEKQTRQGVYEEYTVDITQEYDDARSTFKSAKETKSNKGKQIHFVELYYSSLIWETYVLLIIIKTWIMVMVYVMYVCMYWAIN